MFFLFLPNDLILIVYRYIYDANICVLVKEFNKCIKPTKDSYGNEVTLVKWMIVNDRITSAIQSGIHYKIRNFYGLLRDRDIVVTGVTIPKNY